MDKTVALAVKITADGKSAGAGIDTVTTKTSKLQSAGKLAGRALAAGLGLAVVAGAKAAKAAQEDAVGQAKLANAIKNNTSARDKDAASVESWISAQGKALGVSDSELRPSLEALVTATKDVGEAQKLSALAMDISARKGVSLESVSKKLAKAVTTGNVSALAAYGAETKKADGSSKSLADVTDALTKSYKGAAAANPALEQKKLSIATDELQEKFGAKLIPVLTKATAAGLAVVGWIDKNETAAIAIVATLGGLLAIVKLVSVATKIWTTVTTIHTVASKALNAVMKANPIGLVVVAIMLLVGAVILAYKKSDTFKAIVDKAFRVVGAAASWLWESAIKPAFNKIGDIIGAVGRAGTWLWNNALQPAFKFIIGGVAKVLGMWADMLRTLGKVPGFGWAKTAAEAMQGAADKAQAVADNLKKIPPTTKASVTVTTTYKHIGQTGPYDPDYDTGRMTRRGRLTRGIVQRASGASAAPVIEQHTHHWTVQVPGLIGEKRALIREIKQAFTDGERLVSGSV